MKLIILMGMSIVVIPMLFLFCVSFVEYGYINTDFKVWTNGQRYFLVMFSVVATAFSCVYIKTGPEV